MSVAATSQTPALCRAIAERVQSVVAVQDDVLQPILVALLAQGHVLIEGIPGIGKTLLARTLARSVGCDFRRIQFTNDLMPSDLVGSSVWRQGSETFTFVRGPLFASIVLADEINRTSPRTLSCLLEAMENGSVSVDGKTMALARPFLVLATRNPVEFHGTYPVPEAALDRFLVRVELGYPLADREVDLYRGDDPEQRLAALEPAITKEQLLEAMAAAAQVEVSAAVARYCHRLVQATRRSEAVLLGASPRAGMAWLRAGRARAYLHGRGYVLPDDLKALGVPVLGHRVFMKGGGPTAPMLQRVMAETPVER